MSDRKAYNSTLRLVTKKKLESGQPFGLKRTPLKKVGKQGRRDRVNSKQCKDRADGYCEICGDIGTEHHHLLLRRLFPQYVNDPDNHIWVCHNCHRMAHGLVTQRPAAATEMLLKRLESRKKQFIEKITK